MDILIVYKKKYKRLLPELSERARRLVLAADAKALGYGGISFVHEASDVSRVTIQKGIGELEAGISLPEGRSRRAGGGRKPITETDPKLCQALEDLVAASTRGDPESPLLWTDQGTRSLAAKLARKHPVSHATVATLLKAADYSLQGNQKSHEGKDHPDRDAQFDYINRQAKAFLQRGEPVISVDTKKKGLVGNYKNNGRQWLPKGKPIEVKVHDFPDRQMGKAIPYGIYDLGHNMGYVNVGIHHDTAEFAVASIRRWWQHLGKESYKGKKQLLITADAGGSNGYRLRLWKKELQALADETGLDITVCHFPPGTSKWNKVEHRLFSFISIRWRGKPLTSYRVIVQLIGSTRTRTGLRVYAVLDNKTYALRKKVTDQEMESLRLDPHQFHGEWNYTIRPRK